MRGAATLVKRGGGQPGPTAPGDGVRAQRLLVPRRPRWGDPEHPASLPASRAVSSPYSCLIPDVDITARKQIGFLSLASRVSFLANLKAHNMWRASPVPSAWGGLRLLSEQASAGKACAGEGLCWQIPAYCQAEPQRQHGPREQR